MAKKNGIEILLYNYREDVVAKATVEPEEAEHAEDIRREYEKYFYAAKIVSYVGRRENAATQVPNREGTLLEGKSGENGISNMIVDADAQ